MDTRMNKYNEEDTMSRVSKNNLLYKKINEESIENFDVHSNATVIGNQEDNIDIEKIRKILDTRYNSNIKRKSIKLEEEEEKEIPQLEPTKEYDLGKVLEKARDEQEESYENVRAKKLRNTQFDILNNLNIEVDKKEENENFEEPLDDAAATEQDAIDLFSDIIGDDTQVFEGINHEEIESAKESGIVEIDKVKEENLDNSFYATSVFKKSDFEDENNTDFVDDDKLNIGVKILIGLVIVIFVGGLALFIKSFLKI